MRSTSLWRLGIAAIIAAIGSLTFAQTKLPINSRRVPKLYPRPQSTPLEMLNSYDQVAQDRFQRENMGRFGMSRLVIAPSKTFPAMKGNESPITDLAFVVGFYHVHPLPTKGVQAVTELPPNLKKEGSAPITTVSSHPIFVRTQASPKPFRPYNETIEAKGRRGLETLYIPEAKAMEKWNQENKKAISEACATALPKLKAGQNVTVSIPNHQLYLRPVVAKHQSCIGCHSSNRKGDTLGVLYYVLPHLTKSPS